MRGGNLRISGRAAPFGEELDLFLEEVRGGPEGSVVDPYAVTGWDPDENELGYHQRMTKEAIASAWEAEYRNGRYLGEPPLPFVDDIVAAARTHGLASSDGLYIGCGNGRNYLPLVAGGLDLLGLDLSPTAIAQLERRAPDRAARLVCGDLSALPVGRRYPIVIAIQVLQHGDEATTHREVRRARDLVAPGGLFCVRVNAVGTELEHEHAVVERGDDGGFTARYRAGPKQGLDIHFFTAKELQGLIEEALAPVLPLRLVRTRRDPPKGGTWAQWEGIWSLAPVLER
jgi:Methyltransferase domain